MMQVNKSSNRAGLGAHSGSKISIYSKSCQHQEENRLSSSTTFSEVEGRILSSAKLLCLQCQAVCHVRMREDTFTNIAIRGKHVKGLKHYQLRYIYQYNRTSIGGHHSWLICLKFSQNSWIKNKGLTKG